MRRVTGLEHGQEDSARHSCVTRSAYKVCSGGMCRYVVFVCMHTVSSSRVDSFRSFVPGDWMDSLRVVSGEVAGCLGWARGGRVRNGRVLSVLCAQCTMAASSTPVDSGRNTQRAHERGRIIWGFNRETARERE